MNDKLKQEIVKVSKLLIEQNSFKFHDTVYVQNEGLPIGAATLSIFFQNFTCNILNTQRFMTNF